MLYCDCDNLPTATAAPKYRPDCAAAAPNVDAALAGPANTNVTPAAVTAAAVTDINAITGRRDRPVPVPLEIFMILPPLAQGIGRTPTGGSSG
ncbi:hypothetical protein GCM10027605_66860 [Micromonospora zhanjiangensis]